MIIMIFLQNVWITVIMQTVSDSNNFCIHLVFIWAILQREFKSFNLMRVISHVKGYMYHNSPNIEVPIFIERIDNIYGEWAFNVV